MDLRAKLLSKLENAIDLQKQECEVSLEEEIGALALILMQKLVLACDGDLSKLRRMREKIFDVISATSELLVKNVGD